MKKMFGALSAMALLAAAPAGATLYQFDYSGTSSVDGAFAASLQIEVPIDGGVAASISGTRNGVSVTGLSGYAGADNLFSKGFAYVDLSGLAYSAGGIDYNVYYDNNGSTLYEINSKSNPNGDALTDAALATAYVAIASTTGNSGGNTGGNTGGSQNPEGGSTSAVPEAATWMTMLVGFGALGGMMRRRSPRALLGAL